LHINGMYLVVACFAGILLRRLPEVGEAKQEKYRMLFNVLALSGIALEAQGYVTLLKCIFGDRIPSFLLWNTWYCMAFSFLFLWAIRYAGFPRKLLESRPLRKLSEISFSVFLIHWPVIAAFSFRLLLRMANTMSYNRVFVIILAVTTAAVVLLAFVYEMTCGRLADKLAKALQTAVRRRWPVS
ncbi:MAG: acyltransferase, partial [Clostridium sp.]|nr:acyltransferase [Clostridium sp.]